QKTHVSRLLWVTFAIAVSLSSRQHGTRALATAPPRRPVRAPVADEKWPSSVPVTSRRHRPRNWPDAMIRSGSSATKPPRRVLIGRPSPSAPWRILNEIRRGFVNKKLYKRDLQYTS